MPGAIARITFACNSNGLEVPVRFSGEGWFLHLSSVPYGYSDLKYRRGHSGTQISMMMDGNNIDHCKEKNWNFSVREWEVASSL